MKRQNFNAAPKCVAQLLVLLVQNPEILFVLLWEGIFVHTRQTSTDKRGSLLSEGWVQENKHVAECKQLSGGGLFSCPLPLHHPGPEGTGLFNVDSRAVCPDVEVLDMESPYLTQNSTHMSFLDISAPEKCTIGSKVYWITWYSLFFLHRDPGGHPVH